MKHAEDCPLFAMKALKEAPGSDGIPAEVYKIMFYHRPEVLVGACLHLPGKAIFVAEN